MLTSKLSQERARSCAGWILVGVAVFVDLGRENAVFGQSEPDDKSACTTPHVELAATSSDKTIPAASNSERLRREDEELSRFVPGWVAEAVFYQIFPERFRNGDPDNDPTHDSLEDPSSTPESWQISPWTGDWYARADWEKKLGVNFYEHGVFNRRYGGDLRGIIDKLDYLQDLGINAIYLNPVFYGKSLHKYDAASMHHVDPYFGPDPAGDLELIQGETGDPKTWNWTAADKLFLELIREAHQRKIRLIVDGVFNHTGRAFFAFADLLEKQAASDYQDWYIVESFDDPATAENEMRYKSWWGYESLPEFANDPSGQDLHPAPKQYIFDITRRWMDPDNDGDPSDGIDGWRLDVANEVPIAFWRDWSELVRKLNPEAYTVGEFWDEALEHLIEGQFSGTMNYHGFAFLVKGFLVDGVLTPHDFGTLLQERRENYPPAMQYALQNLVDSHDTDRVGSMIVNAGRESYQQPERFDFDVAERASARNNSRYNVRRPNERERQIQRLVALMQMTYVGAPMIYYGTEAGMWGGDDPCDRMPMVWNDLTYQDQASDPLGRPRKPDSVGFDQKLFDFYRGVIQLRRSYSVLNHGTFELVANDDAAKFFAFRRQADDASVLIVINRGSNPFQWQLAKSASGAPRQIFSTSEDSRAIDLRKDGDHWVATIPALHAVVFDERAAGE